MFLCVCVRACVRVRVCVCVCVCVLMFEKLGKRDSTAGRDIALRFSHLQFPSYPRRCWMLTEMAGTLGIFGICLLFAGK